MMLRLSTSDSDDGCRFRVSESRLSAADRVELCNGAETGFWVRETSSVSLKTAP